MSEPTEQEIWDYIERLKEHWQAWEAELASDGEST